MKKIPIIRTLFGNSEKTKQEIPIFPVLNNEIVYVWGKDNEKFLKNRGYETRLQDVNSYPHYIDMYSLLITKLISIDLALKEFGEIIFLDWDCYVLRNLDDDFYKYLEEKPIQCPLYSHYKEPFEAMYEASGYNSTEIKSYKVVDETVRLYNWKKDDMLVIPNFGFFYSRDKNIGKILTDIAIKHKLKGCVDEYAMFLYANCSVEEYIERYHPKVVRGVAEEMTCNNFMLSRVQKKLNNYIDTKIKMNIYMKHM